MNIKHIVAGILFASIVCPSNTIISMERQEKLEQKNDNIDQQKQNQNQQPGFLRKPSVYVPILATTSLALFIGADHYLKMGITSQIFKLISKNKFISASIGSSVVLAGLFIAYKNGYFSKPQQRNPLINEIILLAADILPQPNEQLPDYKEKLNAYLNEKRKTKIIDNLTELAGKTDNEIKQEIENQKLDFVEPENCFSDNPIQSKLNLKILNWLSNLQLNSINQLPGLINQGIDDIHYEIDQMKDLLTNQVNSLKNELSQLPQDKLNSIIEALKTKFKNRLDLVNELSRLPEEERNDRLSEIRKNNRKKIDEDDEKEFKFEDDFFKNEENIDNKDDNEENIDNKDDNEENIDNKDDEKDFKFDFFKKDNNKDKKDNKENLKFDFSKKNESKNKKNDFDFLNEIPS